MMLGRCRPVRTIIAGIFGKRSSGSSGDRAAYSACGPHRAAIGSPRTAHSLEVPSGADRDCNGDTCLEKHRPQAANCERTIVLPRLSLAEAQVYVAPVAALSTVGQVVHAPESR